MFTVFLRGPAKREEKDLDRKLGKPSDQLGQEGPANPLSGRRSKERKKAGYSDTRYLREKKTT